jgi:sortase A
MRKWTGVICVFLGVVCILSAVGLVGYNRWEDKNAEKMAQEILEDVQSIIEAKTTGPDDADDLPVDTDDSTDDTEKKPTEMASIKVDGYDCIGILSVPVLDLELPVLTDWSKAKLKKAPCHYYGTYYQGDFVIAAHNYQSHFGRLSELQTGDIVIFTDVNGADHCYKVVLLETLPREATHEMITSGFALSLYTCTPGGASRVTVRCDAVN